MSKSIHDCELIYPNKKPASRILEETPSIELIRESKSQLSFSIENSWENMLILGENLFVLQTLIKTYNLKGKIQLIYIDPPFGTNTVWRIGEKRTATVSTSTKYKHAYSDTLIGSAYLEFLRERLILLRELLSDTGTIYVHIDTKIGHYVKILMDEVFGVDNFINDITRIKCNPKNFARKGYGNIKDMILFYSKTSNYKWNDIREPFTEAELERLYPKVDPDGKRYTTVPLHAPGETINGPTGKEWKGMKPPEGRHWRYAPKILDELDEKGLIEWSRNRVPRLKIFAEEGRKKGKKVQDVWANFKDPQYPNWPTQKNIDLIKRIIEASSDREDIVLDAFMGSGTTILAAESLKRKWIGIDNAPQSIEITVKRLKKLKNVSQFGVYISKERKKR
ncbi:MAG: site-specific DNA-methyltransferase [Candidatus Heimdallarchaeaceae archaeon]